MAVPSIMAMPPPADFIMAAANDVVPGWWSAPATVVGDGSDDGATEDGTTAVAASVPHEIGNLVTRGLSAKMCRCTHFEVRVRWEGFGWKDIFRRRYIFRIRSGGRVCRCSSSSCCCCRRRGGGGQILRVEVLVVHVKSNAHKLLFLVTARHQYDCHAQHFVGRKFGRVRGIGLQDKLVQSDGDWSDQYFVQDLVLMRVVCTPHVQDLPLEV